MNYCPNSDVTGSVLNTTVPTVLHLDLHNNGKIVDPYFGDNYKKLEWVSSCNVTYSKNITFDSDMTYV